MKTPKVFFGTLLISCGVIITLFLTGKIDYQFMILLLFLFISTHCFMIYYLYKIQRDFNSLNQTIENINNDSIAGGIITSFITHQKLNANLNRLVKKIEKLNYKKEENELTISILTNSLTSPIIYIDRDGKIRYVNHQFIDSFDIYVEVNDIYEKLRIQNIYKFIDDAFVFETTAAKVLKVKDNFYQANAIPINNTSNEHFSFMGILFIFHDITELKKYEVLQREFLADASHELKTPIMAIKGAAEILLNGEKHDKKTITEFLSIIKSENERMERIVNDILLISRLENDKGLIYYESINLKPLLEQAAEILRFKLESKKQKLFFNSADNLIIEGDYERLKTVFINLLSNAINYTDEGKNIYINARQDKDHVYVSIKDEGIGIGENDLNHIFERFYRVDKARSRETGGTGLGLAIVKSILDSHKAIIKVNSKLNEGSEFIITFKIKK